MSTVPCPSCTTTLQLPPSAAGKQVRCPKCQHIFLVPAPAEESTYNVQPAPPVPRPMTPAPIPMAPPPRDDDPWDDDRRPRDRRDEDDEYSTRRRRRDYDDDEDDDAPRVSRRIRRHEAAKAALGGPAIGLMIAGGLGLVCPIFGIVNTAANPQQAREPGFMVGFVIGLTVTYVWAICVLVGANAMRTASNKGLMIFGCIVSFLPCSCLWLLAMPMGIWALVALNQPEVSESIR